MGTQSIIDQ